MLNLNTKKWLNIKMFEICKAFTYLLVSNDNETKFIKKVEQFLQAGQVH